MANSYYYLNAASKAVTRPLISSVIFLLCWSTWSYSMLNKGYNDYYEKKCSEEDPTSFFKALGWIFIVFTIFHICFFVYRFIVYQRTKNNISNILVNINNKEDPSKDPAKDLFNTTMNRRKVSDMIYYALIVVFYIPILGISSKIVHLFREDSCDIKGWDYFGPISIICLMVLLFIIDGITLGYSIMSYKDTTK